MAEYLAELHGLGKPQRIFVVSRLQQVDERFLQSFRCAVVLALEGGHPLHDELGIFHVLDDEVHHFFGPVA